MDPRLILPIVMQDAEKLGHDISIQIHSDGEEEWIVCGTIDKWPVVGYVHYFGEGEFGHALWFALEIH